MVIGRLSAPAAEPAPKLRNQKGTVNASVFPISKHARLSTERNFWDTLGDMYYCAGRLGGIGNI
jgi:hypothetical protein